MKILLVEDDQMIAALLQDALLQEGYAVEHVHAATEALACCKESHYDLFILDLTLPDMDGLALCKRIRQSHQRQKIGIIISSARTQIDDKLFALEHGADDYLPKPYDPRELLMRIKILAKHLDLITSSTVFKLDTNTSTLYKKGKALDLSVAEFEIFKLLYDHKNQILSRMDIANAISSHRFESGVESINVLLGRLRKKLDDEGKNGSYIKTIRGLGYRFYE